MVRAFEGRTGVGIHEEGWGSVRGVWVRLGLGIGGQVRVAGTQCETARSQPIPGARPCY